MHTRPIGIRLMCVPSFQGELRPSLQVPVGEVFEMMPEWLKKNIGLPCGHRMSPNCMRWRCLAKRTSPIPEEISPDIYAEEKHQLQHLKEI